jgi:hypothetical protein
MPLVAVESLRAPKRLERTMSSSLSIAFFLETLVIPDKATKSSVLLSTRSLIPSEGQDDV